MSAARDGQRIPGERLHGLLLRAYPAEFRLRYGAEMALLFRDLRRDVARSGGSVPGFWAEIMVDLGRSALRLRLEAFRGWGQTTFMEAEMLVMSIVTIMVGALEAAGAFTEVWSNIQHPRGAGPGLIGSTMGVVAGALLLGSGLALLRRSPGAVPLARAAAVTCILVFLLISYVIPMMGYFAQILGIGFPVVLLVYLHRTGSGGLSSDTEWA